MAASVWGAGDRRAHGKDGDRSERWAGLQQDVSTPTTQRGCYCIAITASSASLAIPSTAPAGPMPASADSSSEAAAALRPCTLLCGRQAGGGGKRVAEGGSAGGARGGQAGRWLGRQQAVQRNRLAGLCRGQVGSGTRLAGRPGQTGAAGRLPAPTQPPAPQFSARLPAAPAPPPGPCTAAASRRSCRTRRAPERQGASAAPP